MTISGRGRARVGGFVLSLAGATGAAAQEPATIPYIQRHAVFKPAFDIPTRRPLMETGYEFPTKPLFVRGYGGNLYGQGPREAFIPTGYGTGSIQAVGATAPSPTARPGRFRFLRRCR